MYKRQNVVETNAIYISVEILKYGPTKACYPWKSFAYISSIDGRVLNNYYCVF